MRSLFDSLSEIISRTTTSPTYQPVTTTVTVAPAVRPAPPPSSITPTTAGVRPAPPPPSTTNPTNVRPAPPIGTQITYDNLTMARAFADVIYSSSDDAVYVDKAVKCAAYIKRPVVLNVVRPAPPIQQTPQSTTSLWDLVRERLSISLRPVYSDSNEHPYTFPTAPVVSGTPDLERSNSGVKARLNVLSFVDDVASFIARARNAGFAPPDNPFTELARLHAQRTSIRDPIRISTPAAGDVLFNIQAYVDLLEAEKQGAINFDTASFNTAQLEHINLSYSGLGGTGNNAADLMKLLPNADEIKMKKAEESLSILNFSKRQPHMIFTAEYSPNQTDGSQGVLLGWKRIPDAAGYIIKRHGVLENTDTEFEITNDKLLETEKAFMTYAKLYVLTFYDAINPASVCLFVDSSTKPHEYYIYKIQAYQIKKDDSTSIIPSRFVALTLSGQQKMNIGNRIRELDPNAVMSTGEETISPWPVFAEQLLGDASLDWILAAANVRAAIDRNESKSVSRSYSYLNAKTSWLLNQADQGKLVKPASIQDVRNAVNDSIRTYGVVQTIETLLEETGILYYFDARDARTDTTFDRAGTLSYVNSGLIGVVAAAIDPESATINLKTLSTNLFQILTDGKLESYDTTLRGGAIESSKPAEIRIDPDITRDNVSETGIQYIEQLADLSETSVDLTTFDGLAKFIRAIRTMSDFGPNRIPPTTQSPISLINPRIRIW